MVLIQTRQTLPQDPQVRKVRCPQLDGICWICGAQANSREHKIKKSDLRSAYGSGSYHGDDSPVYVQNRRISRVQGAGSKLVKYKKSICANCNNSRTQPHDIAYDQFVTWLAENELEVLRSHTLDLRDVFGEDYEEGQLNLFRYFAKSFGCRLVYSGAAVPIHLSAFVLGDAEMTQLSIAFSINSEVLSMDREHWDGFFRKGPLMAVSQKCYQWHEGWRWMRISYGYGVDPLDIAGSLWRGKHPKIELAELPMKEPPPQS